jgi:hypothetical protein
MNTILKIALSVLAASLALASPAIAQIHHHSHESRHHPRTGVSQNKAVGSALASSATATVSKSSLTLAEGYRDAGWALRHRYGGYWTSARFRSLRAWRRIGNRLRFRYSFSGDSVSAFGYLTVWKAPSYGDPRFIYTFSHYPYG